MMYFFCISCYYLYNVSCYFILLLDLIGMNTDLQLKQGNCDPSLVCA